MIERLTARGYRPAFDEYGMHLWWSPDWGAMGAPAVCLGCLPPHRAFVADHILEAAGWPTERIAKCPVHPEVERD